LFEKLLNEGLTLLFKDSSDHANPVIQPWLRWQV